MEWGLQSQHEDIIGNDPNRLTRFLGVDSITSYVWIHNLQMKHFPDEPYGILMEEAPKLWRTLTGRYDVPYFPNVTMGWDPSPRTDQSKEYIRGEYPCTSILVGNTPEAFEKSLLDARNFLDENKTGPGIVTLYAWNEWTEGGYLEPDTLHGMSYLEAIKRIFG
jgi:hypothetical protein